MRFERCGNRLDDMGERISSRQKPLLESANKLESLSPSRRSARKNDDGDRIKPRVICLESISKDRRTARRDRRMLLDPSPVASSTDAVVARRFRDHPRAIRSEATRSPVVVVAGDGL